MDIPQAERCKGLRRFSWRLRKGTDYLSQRMKLLRDPETKKQARLIAGLQVGLSSAGCALLAWFAFLFFFNKWYEYTAPDPIVPTNPRPAIVWGTPEYFLGKKPIECLHEGELFHCDVLAQDSKPIGGADAYIFYGTHAEFLPLPRSPRTLWAVIHEESPRNNLFFMHEKGLQLFNFTATFSQHSDVPMPFVYLHTFDVITDTKYYKNVSTKNAALKDIAPVLYMQSDCSTSTERDYYVQQLMEYINVDSYGICLNNKNLPLGTAFQPLGHRQYLQYLEHPLILDFVSHYKFWIAIENGVCTDYITEKLWRALTVGVVPIYFGAPNVRDYLPHPKAAILLEDYPTPARMAARLHELNQNDQLYEEHLRHKTARRIDNQLYKDNEPINFEKALHRLQCMTCVRLHENSTRVNMATKNHYDCPEPISAMTLDRNPYNEWITNGRISEEIVDKVYEKIYTARANNISESFDGLHKIKFENVMMMKNYRAPYRGDKQKNK